MARMIPSPDWFIGVDSFDLCVDGNWLDSITIEVNWKHNLHHCIGFRKLVTNIFKFLL